MLIDFFYDVETYCELDLKEVNTPKYVLHPSADLTLLTYALGRTGVVKSWVPGSPIPADLLHVAENPHLYRMIAWNIAFDYLVWTVVLKKYIPTLVRPQIENIEDGMALSCHFRTGASLEAAAAMTGTDMSKDKQGRLLMLKSCKPDRFGKRYYLNPEEFTHFERYGVMDTDILRNVYYRLPALPPMERWAFEWTFTRNLKGIRIDEELVYQLHSIVASHLPSLIAEFEAITGGIKLNSPTKLLPWFQQFWPDIKDLQKDTVRDMLLTTAGKPQGAIRALQIKDLAGSTSITKIPTAINQMVFSRLYLTLAYHYTQTKRFAGRGIQIQNFPRFDNSRIDKIDFDTNVADLTGAVLNRRPFLKDPIGFVKNLLRRIWLPDEGKHFYSGDFSKVEPSVLFWLMDLGPIPKKWYEEMAAAIYNKEIEDISKDSDERQVGKTAALSCGYGAGWASFKEKTYKDTGIMLSDDDAKKAVGSYRKKYACVKAFWDDLENAMKRAIKGETVSLCKGKLHVMPIGAPWKGVKIRLPSGSHLYYHNAQCKWEKFQDEIYYVENGETKMRLHERWREIIKYDSDMGGGRVGTAYVYGGLLCENVVSATGRDLMIPAMWRLENAGFDVLTTIHDEIWGQGPEGQEAEFERLMCVPPSWYTAKIDAEVKGGLRYLK